MAPPSERIIGIVNDTGLGVDAALSSTPKPHWFGRPVPRVSLVRALPARISSSHVLGGSANPASLRSGLIYPRPVEVRYTGMATILPPTEQASRSTAWLKSSHSSYLNCPRSATNPAFASGWLSWLCAPTMSGGLPAWDAAMNVWVATFQLAVWYWSLISLCSASKRLIVS